MHIDNIKIACDPVLCAKGHVQDYGYFQSTRLNNPIFTEKDFTDINLWLLTHNHEDHIDKYGFKMIKKDATIYAHKSLKPFFQVNGYKNISYLDWNEQAEFSAAGITLKIKAVPAIHAKKRFLGAKIGNGNGYFVEISKSEFKYFIYITGDAVYNNQVKEYFKNKKIDLIIANAGSAMIGKSFISRIVGRITNSGADIGKMASALHPRMLIPVHWGTFSHYSETIDGNDFSEFKNIKVIEVGESLDLTKQ